MKRTSLAALSAFTLALAPAAWADTITAITPHASTVMLVNGKATVNFMVSGQGNEETDCGMWIEYSDDGSPDTRVIGRRDGYLPREFEHSFARAGQFTVIAKGQRVKQTFGCSGAASTVVTVVEERQGRRHAAAQTCPEGWMLRESSYNRRTGAFTCTPIYPPQRMDCGPGLRYFAGDNLIGCRVGK
jgi:hypothetical protein